MARYATIQDTISTHGVFRRCMEKFVSTESNNEETFGIKCEREGELCFIGLPKVKSFLEDVALLLNRTVPKMRSLSTIELLHNFYLYISKLLK